MTLMFYHFAFLLCTIYTAKRRVKRFKSDYALNLNEKNKFLISDMDLERYHKKFEASKECSANYKNLYDCIVKEFVKTIIRVDPYESDHDEVREYKLEITIPTNYDLNTIKKFYNGKKENIFKEIVIRNEVEDFEFECAYNLFVKFAAFAIDTMRTVYKIRKISVDYKSFRNSLIKDTTLFENFIISINWLSKLTTKQLEYSLLHNFKKVSVFDCCVQNNISLTITYDFYIKCLYTIANETIMDRSIGILLKKYKDDKNLTNKKIFEFEDISYFQDYYKNTILHNSASESNYKSKIAMPAFIMMRCFETNINLIAKSRYFNDVNLLKYDIHDSFAQFDIYNKIYDNISNKNIFEMKFECQDIYYTNIIICVSKISSNNDVKIEHLTNFTDHFISKINIYINNMYENFMTECFDNLIRKNNKNEDKIIELKKQKKDLINELNGYEGPTRETLFKNRYDFWERIYINAIYLHEFDVRYKALHDKIENFENICNDFCCLRTLREQKMQQLEISINKFVKEMININSLQSEISEEFEEIIDNRGNTLNNTLKVLCENTLKTKVFANETAQEFGNIDAIEKNIAADFILRINTHIKSNAQIKEIINTNMTKINKILISNTKLRGLIIEAEQSAKKLIEKKLDFIYDFSTAKKLHMYY